MEVCWSCDEGVLVVDPDSCAVVCNSCGRVESSAGYVRQDFTSEGQPTGQLHSVSDFGYRERKLHRARAVLDDISSRLGLSAPRAAEASALASEATDGALGEGDWFPVFSAACCFLVARRHSFPISLAEAASAVGCDARELGRMVARVSRHLELPALPEFDAVGFLERAVRSCPCLARVEPHQAEKIVGQGRFLLQCATKWFLTTGRQPLPLIAAIVAFVSEVNKVEVSVEEIAKEIYAVVSTSQLRLKELMETLVRVGRKLLPWGQDVTTKNLVHNAPILLRMMQMKSEPKSKLQFFDGLGFNMCSYDNKNESKYFERNDGDDDTLISFDDLENVKLSSESISSAYKKVMDKISFLKKTGEIDKYQGKKRKKDLDIGMWSTLDGIWDSDKSLTLEEVLARNVGYDALPPSFITGIEKRNQIKAKIKAAKCRINEIMKPQFKVNLGFDLQDKEDEEEEEEGAHLEQIMDRKRKRRRKCQKVGLDWEDCIIELLVLHRVDEDEIANGQYNRLLDLHVFNSLSKGE